MIEIPYITVEVALAIVWFGTRITLCIRNRRVNWQREVLMLLMWASVAAIVRFSFFPFSKVAGCVQPLRFDPTRIVPLRVNLVPIVHIFQHDSLRDVLINVLGNTAMYIPYGFLVPIAFRQLDAWWKVVATGALMSLCVEITQLLFFERASDVDDLILNTLGCAMGYAVYALIFKRRKNNRAK